MSVLAIVGWVIVALILLATGVLVFDKKHKDLRALAGLSLVFLVMGLMLWAVYSLGGTGRVGPSFRAR